MPKEEQAAPSATQGERAPSSVIGRRGLLKLEERLLSEGGLEVYTPTVDYRGIDLVTRHEHGGRPVYRAVQVKYSSGRGGRYLFGVMKDSFHPRPDLLVAFVCGSADQVLLIPSADLKRMLARVSKDARGQQYKVGIELRRNIFYLRQGGGRKIPLNEYLDTIILRR